MFRHGFSNLHRSGLQCAQAILRINLRIVIDTLCKANNHSLLAQAHQRDSDRAIAGNIRKVARKKDSASFPCNYAFFNCMCVTILHFHNYKSVTNI